MKGIIMDKNKLAELKETARKILVYNRLQILNKHPFIGTVAMNLDIVPIRDARCTTAMTDGKTVYFDIDFLSRLKQEEIEFVLGHEFWHVVMMHFLRGDKKDHRTFNIASDMEVNQILQADGFVAPKEAVFPNANHSKECRWNFRDGLSAEEYYELLIKENQVNNYSPKGNSESEGKNEKSNCSKNKNRLNGQFDSHYDKNQNQEEALNKALEGNPTDKYGAVGADEDFNPGEIKNETEERNLAENIRQSIVSAAQQYERSRGKLPGYIKKQVDKLLESKLPWREMLAAFITAGFQNRSNWNAPNRRFAWNGTYLPSHTGDMMRIAVGIDTSGSCAQDCPRFLSEINAIARSFDSYELHVIQCDTEVKDYTVYDENNPLNPDNPIEFKGFGGTKLHPIFDYIQLNDIDVDAVVIFTDSECEEFADDGSIELPVMWMITGNRPGNNLKIGSKVNISE